jgi:hypothetical protein
MQHELDEIAATLEPAVFLLWIDLGHNLVAGMDPASAYAEFERRVEIWQTAGLLLGNAKWGGAE